MNQSVQLINKFSYLPSDIVNMIIYYSGIIAYRNGKYINRIDKKDNRYNILLNIPRPIKVSHNQYCLGLRDYPRLVIKFSINYIINENNIIIYVYKNEIGNNGMIYSQKSPYMILIN